MKCKTENTEKGKAEDRKKEQQSRRKIGILAMSAAVVLIILGSICLLLLPNKADSKGIQGKASIPPKSVLSGTGS